MFLRQNGWQQQHTTVTIILAQTTLGSPTQIGSFLFFVALPKVDKASTVTCCCRQRYHANLHQWKHGFFVETNHFQGNSSPFVACLWVVLLSHHRYLMIDQYFSVHRTNFAKNSIFVSKTFFALSELCPILQNFFML